MVFGYDARPIGNENKAKKGGIPSEFDKLKVPPENFDKVRHFHETLYYGAVKALIGQMGRKHFKGLTAEADKQRLAKCLDRIETRKNEVVEAAKCLVESRKGQIDEKREKKMGEKKGEKEEQKVPFVQEENEKEAKTESFNYLFKKSTRLLRYMGRKRRPRDILISDRTFAHITEEKAETFTDRENEGRIVEEKQSVEAEGAQTFKKVSLLSSAPLASRADKSVGSRITNLVVKLLNGRRSERTNERWPNIYGRLKRLAKEMERRKRVPGSKVFEKRMYDIVLDRAEASMSPEEKHSHVGLLQDGLKLIDMAVANRTGFSLHNLRLFSPRFLPITPDKGGPLHNNSMLSPTLLAMYEEHDNRSIGNVPKMLRNAGIGEKERLGLIGTLMDITGTTEKAEQTLKMFKEMDLFNEDSMDMQQKAQCEQNGYTFGRKAQIEKLLRDQAVDLSKLPELEGFEMYDRMSEQQKEAALWATVEQIASGNGAGQPPRKTGRVKRTFATRVREPAILSPFTFAPSYGLVVLGPTILSPNAFSPSILSPTVLSPHVLSPNLFRAQILSPSLLGPIILSPLMAQPYILSPGVLGSLILNPTILTPFILSPVAIGPSILNPFALSPVIFSPLLLAPDIVSPQTLGGAIFSPVMLSPAILTQAYLMVSIFSPSFLS
ncbi:hypothetical protein niasHT_010341 [Heterodera trifolii]|uniref:Uncharacterized protein n=1 Tax=Heterodera trifolii TaxID=157864 RepID=A0ABD2M6S2_9BILA